MPNKLGGIAKYAREGTSIFFQCLRLPTTPLASATTSELRAGQS